MRSIFTSLGRALRSLAQPSILVHLMWPMAVSLVLWAVLAWVFWATATGWIAALFGNFAWLSGLLGQEGASGAAHFTAGLLLFLLLFPLIYVTASLIVATVALPFILERVAARDYADVVERRGGTQFGSVVNATLAATVYLVVLIVSLPLWLIPGLGLVIPLLLSAWLNQRAYRYDALMLHAGPDEYRRLVATRRGGLMSVGVLTGALAYVPLVNLLAPAFSGLAFVHFCLGALREQRAEAAREA